MEQVLAIKLLVGLLLTLLFVPGTQAAGSESQLGWMVVSRKASRAFGQKNYQNARRHYLIALKALKEQAPQSECAFELKLNIAECDRLMNNLVEGRQILSGLAAVIDDKRWSDPLFPARYWRRVASLEQSSGDHCAAAEAMSRAVTVLESVFGPEFNSCIKCRKELATLVSSAEKEIEQQLASGDFDNAAGSLVKLQVMSSRLSKLQQAEKFSPSTLKEELTGINRLIRAWQLHGEKKHQEAAKQIDALPPEMLGPSVQRFLAEGRMHEQGDATKLHLAQEIERLPGHCGSITRRLRDQYAWYCFETAAIQFRKGDFSVPVTQLLEEARKVGPLPSEARDETERRRFDERTMLYLVNMARVYNGNHRLERAVELINSLSPQYINAQAEGFFPRFIRVSQQIAYQQILNGHEAAGLERFKKVLEYCDRISNTAQRNELKKVVTELRKTALTLTRSSTLRSNTNPEKEKSGREL